ncbi:MAG: leucine-rich repeat protein [Ruminococcus sp.]|nr:leucine-rich repeat protein [Ruminococcus sp.]
MTDFKTVIKDEYSDITFNVEASEIISAYKKERRRRISVLTSSALCCMLIVTLFISFNPRAVEGFVSSTQSFLSGIFPPSDSISEITGTKPSETYSPSTTSVKKEQTAKKHIDKKNRIKTKSKEQKMTAEAKQISSVPVIETQPETEAEETVAKVNFDVLKNGKIKLTRFETDEKKIVIPKRIEGYKVAVIGSGIFDGNNSVEEITLPDTVTEIEEKAFKNLRLLTSVKMKNVKVIGGEAFEGCKSLKSINLGSIKKIRAYAFKDCAGIESVSIPASAEIVGSGAFYNCSGLKTAYIYADCDDNDEFSYGETFKSCKNLQKAVIGDGVKRVYSEMFQDCTSLSEVLLPLTLEAIEFKAFYGCTKLLSIEIPRKVKYYGKLCLGYYGAENKVSGFTIKGYRDSSAYVYAENNGFKFENVGANRSETLVTLFSHIKTLKVGEKYKLEYSVENPVGDTTFKSSDKTVASVSKKGVIKALKKGTASITVTNNSASAKFIVIVE